MQKVMRGMKWQLLAYSFVTTVVTLGLGAGAWIYFEPENDLGTGWFIIAAALILLVGTFVGYVGAKRIVRIIDRLHLGIMQISKGNLSERIPDSGKAADAPVYETFNRMAESIEERIKLLQKLGEENAMMHIQSSEEAVLEERRRLARDLHDTVSQQLFAMHMAASSLPKMLDVNPEGARQLVDQLVTMSHHAQRQMRMLIAQLRPLELEGKTLQEALEQWFPSYCGQNDLQGALDIQMEGRMSEPLEHQLFLIMQEGLANVVKHAKATEVSLSLHDMGHQYTMSIRDNGVGFDAGTGPRQSYGLSTMRERAQKLGGEAEVLSRPGFGTSVKVSIPKFSA